MEYFIGSIVLFAGNFAPRDWALCNGQLLPISQNEALFAILGTTFGGDGINTFALPDLRGRAPIHAGNGPGLSPRQLGQSGGSESVGLQVANLPAHSHPATATAQVVVSNGTANTEEPSGAFLTATGSNFYSTSGVSGENLGGVSAGVTVGNTGGNIPVSVMQPYLAVNYIICLNGIFPSRN